MDKEIQSTPLAVSTLLSRAVNMGKKNCLVEYEGGDIDGVQGEFTDIDIGYRVMEPANRYEYLVYRYKGKVDNYHLFGACLLGYKTNTDNKEKAQLILWMLTKD